MKCPFCDSSELKVVDKRDSNDDTRRRRECLSCNKRFTTYERVEPIELSVIKKNGTVESFNTEKLKSGIVKACNRRDISMKDIDSMVTKIENELKNTESNEIPTERIANVVMKHLRELDEVSYIRFASVYKDFDGIDSFVNEIRHLYKDRARNIKCKITRTIKRNGEIVPFEKEKITEAIFKAAKSVGGKDKDLAAQVADSVVLFINENFSNEKLPTVEDIQDAVEKVLAEEGHYTTVKAYILYRQTKKNQRETEHMVVDVEKTVSAYLNQSTWKVNENSNEQYSFSGLLLYTAGKLISNYALNNVYTPQIAEAHRKAYIHIHDMTNAVIGYCAGWSLKTLLIKGFGGVKNKVDCRPAKHMNTVVHQMVNFIGCLQMEFAGAQAFSSVDTLLAPFVKQDKMTFKEVKQCIQQLIFSLNIPSRWGSQYPFSNLTFDWVVPKDMKNEKAIIGGEMMDFTYADCQKEMDIVNKAFLEVMIEGDASGRIFSFPIPTYNLTKDFDWDSDNAKLLFDLTAKYGTPYFQNYIGSNLDPSAVRAMCCRLNLDQRELINRPGSMWGPGDNTGSIGVVTMNLNRFAYEASGDKSKFFDIIRKYMIIAKDSLEIKREMIERNLERGLMPYTREYLGSFDNHFSTIGLCGMNEACINLIGKDIVSEDGKALAIETLKYMRSLCKEFQDETGRLYNLEATPAESTSYRFALADKKMYPNIYTAGEDEPFLTNSSQLPVEYTEDAVAAIQHQNDIQPLYNGGTIFHTFLGERMANGEVCKKLIQKIANNTRLPYFSITPTFSVCNDHGYLVGEHFNCPTCEKPAEVFSRIVGYYRPVQNWNKGKKEEYKFRLEFDADKTMCSSFTGELPGSIEKATKKSISEGKQKAIEANGKADKYF